MTTLHPPQQTAGSFMPPLVDSGILVRIKLVGNDKNDVFQTFLAPGAPKTVAAFARDVLSELAPGWLLRLIRKSSAMPERKKGGIVLSFGCGHELLVLMEGTDIPKDASRLPRMSVTVCMQGVPPKMDDDDEEDEDEEEDEDPQPGSMPIVAPHENIWDHVRACSIEGGWTGKKAPLKQVTIYLMSNASAPFGAHQQGLTTGNNMNLVRMWTNHKDHTEILRLEHANNVKYTMGGSSSKDEDAPDDSEKPKAKPKLQQQPKSSNINTPQEKKKEDAGGEAKKRGRPVGSKNKPKADNDNEKKGEDSDETATATPAKKSKTNPPASAVKSSKKKKNKKPQPNIEEEQDV